MRPIDGHELKKTFEAWRERLMQKAEMKLDVMNVWATERQIELIDAAIDELERMPEIREEPARHGGETQLEKLSREVAEKLLAAYPNGAEFTAVRHGHWEFPDRNPHFKYCSECDGANFGYNFTYCPHCGAKMDGGEQNATD